MVKPLLHRPPCPHDPATTQTPSHTACTPTHPAPAPPPPDSDPEKDAVLCASASPNPDITATYSLRNGQPTGAHAATDSGGGGGGGDDDDDDRTVMNDTALLFDRPDEFPEGGLHAWLAVCGGFWCLFWSFGLVNTFGVYEEYYLRTILHHKSSSQVAWIGSFQYGFLFAMGPFAGRLFDAGHLRPAFAVGTGFFVVCHMLLSLCKTYAELFLAQGVGVSLGCALLFNLGTMVPSHWFLRKRAFANGLVASGSSIGGTVLPIAARKLIDRPNVGFPWCMRIFGFLGLATLIPSYFALRQRLVPQISFRHGGWRRVQWISFAEFKSLAFCLTTAGAFLLFLTLYNVWTYLDIFTTVNNIPKGSYFLSIINASSTLGRILPGALADRIGRFNMMIPMCAIAATILFIWPLATHLRGLIPASILYGISSGTFVSVLPSCLAQIGPTETVGARIGTSYFVLSLAGFFGTPIGGAVLGTHNSRWWPLMLYSAAVAAAGTAVMSAARLVVSSGRLRAKV